MISKNTLNNAKDHRNIARVLKRAVDVAITVELVVNTPIDRLNPINNKL